MVRIGEERPVCNLVHQQTDKSGGVVHVVLT